MSFIDPNPPLFITGGARRKALASAFLAAYALVVSGCDRQSATPVQPDVATSSSGTALAGVLDRSHAGTPLPKAMLALPDGKQRQLGDFAGEPLLVNVWATWCAPCVVEMPMLNTLAQDREGHLRVITVSQDLGDPAKVQAFFTSRHLRNLEPWLDPQNTLGFAYGTGVLPTTVLYDANGEEVWRMIGGHDWSSASAAQLLNLKPQDR
ncbi:TlpA disulfide reductase family protein [Croceicoccus sp. F390]|uniref:TlpA disulfide reductase family protein n=1 Tax=Croceicoccus esteveae TaxID=3075597 RepID=A0ABU2ZIN0_9SPHN|nr:TlpA disulfide reductase family protein [Croceicoccus sp. F390]MDT0575267.1 TlpA disulfide reductase family protein [Croceicoccus sp. F390]